MGVRCSMLKAITLRMGREESCSILHIGIARQVGPGVTIYDSDPSIAPSVRRLAPTTSRRMGSRLFIHKPVLSQVVSPVHLPKKFAKPYGCLIDGLIDWLVDLSIKRILLFLLRRRRRRRLLLLLLLLLQYCHSNIKNNKSNSHSNNNNDAKDSMHKHGNNRHLFA